MTEDKPNRSGRVDVSVELTGAYEDIVRKLDASEAGDSHLERVITDLSALLETVERMDGGTRSAIAGELPADLEESYDAEDVVATLQVLERYGLVILDGNTWKPGPELAE